MQPYKLNKNEKSVLYGLVSYPEYSDVQIAEKTGVKRPTVTKIKNKLREAGLYRTMNIPNYYAAGAKTILYYHNAMCTTPNKESLKKFREVIHAFSHVSVFNIRSGSVCLGLAVFNDYAHLQKTLDEIIEVTVAAGLLKNCSMFPFALQMTEFPIYLETTHLVDRAYALGINETSKRGVSIPEEPPKLSSKERSILEALVRYPDASDTFISDRLGVSRPTVSEKRGIFYSREILKKANVPDFVKLGYEIMCFFLIPYNRNLDNRAGVNTPQLVTEVLRPIILARRQVVCAGIFVARDYHEYSNLIEELAKRRNQNIDIVQEPIFTAISPRDIAEMHIDLAGPLREIR